MRPILLDGPARGHLAMLAFSFGIAGSFSLGSMVANLISPVALTASRFFLSSILIGIIVALTVRVERSYLDGLWRYFIAGALMATYFVLMFIGLQTASAVSTSAVFTLTPVMSGFFGWVLLRQVMSRHSALALAIGAAGAIWVIFGADIDSLLAFRIGSGEAIFFVGCVAHAIYTPFLRKVNRGEPVQVFVLGMVVTGTILLAAYGWRDIAVTDWIALPAIVWITIAYLTIIATTLTFMAVNYASLRLPSAKVMAYTYLTPSWVIIWELAWGRGIPDLKVFIGVLVTVLALLMLLRNEEN